MINVKPITFAFFLKFKSSEYFTFSIIGYIISQKYYCYRK